MSQHKISQAPVPMRLVGPVRIVGDVVDDSVMLPLATYETTLWPSVGRGARVATLAGGMRATVLDERMTRSILLEAEDASHALSAWQSLSARKEEMNMVVRETSRFARLIDLHHQIVGNMLYVRLEFTTGDAAGHNMVTLASEKLQDWLLSEYPALKYTSISANYCTDKKATAVNGILGRGKSVVCELTIPRDLCERRLKTTPEAVVDLNIKKNLIGTMLAGGIRSANAHFANMLLAFYLATGQDAANIVEGSQGIVHCEVRDGDLYFSVSLPNLIVGSVGHGKGLEFVEENLRLLGCKEEREPGENARRLAVICAAGVLCGELSLLAAQTNPGELMAAHVKFER
ncbi:hydroxymethylglutaryl-CoA reductase [Parendozoicomonas sp. Alg238-R29]|uniref:hydroxymethylglutaryl-CoA reductase n=1 Tax=Parendozoicomonas sp. Alg238-R29 TaxID=2993446 RepID=UPI00248D7233|nr:hydroxymethylglutaryl-CoA reductase [Parendozoicomonas sp. Alg238-R29]